MDTISFLETVILESAQGSPECYRSPSLSVLLVVCFFVVILLPSEYSFPIFCISVFLNSVPIE